MAKCKARKDNSFTEKLRVSRDIVKISRDRVKISRDIVKISRDRVKITRDRVKISRLPRKSQMDHSRQRKCETIIFRCKY